MTLIIAIAAFAIDGASWFTTHHKAQVTADAMALAAANYMATNHGSTAASNAQSLGQNPPYTTGSGLNPSNATVTVNPNYTVTATVTTSGSTSFASGVGISPPTIKATAVASYVTGLTPYALFAKDSSGDCSSGITFGNKGGGSSNNDTITGGVHSNGSLFGGLGGTSTVGAISYGCPTAGTTSGNQLGSNGNTTVSVPPVQTTTTMDWPVPYDSSSCTLPGTKMSCYFDPSSSCTYTAGSGTPPANVTATYSSSEHAYDLSINGNVGSSSSYQTLCAPGGTIAFNGGTNTAVYGTLYAANFSWPGNNNNIALYPPPNALGIYYTGAGTVTIGGNKFNVALEGAYIYAPNGTVQMYGNNGTGFIEAQAIVVSGNGWGFVGAGPQEPGNYGDSLIQ